MKFPLLPAVCLGLMLCGVTRADDAADRQEIVRSAREMVDSTFTGNIASVLKFTHPSVAEISGGEAALRKVIDATVAQMKQLGLEFVSMDVSEPEKFFVSGEKTYALVKTRSVLQIPGKTRMTEVGAMIAVREYPGGAWTFVRVSAPLAANRPLLEKLLPGIPSELVIEAPARAVAEPIVK